MLTTKHTTMKTKHTHTHTGGMGGGHYTAAALHDPTVRDLFSSHHSIYPVLCSFTVCRFFLVVELRCSACF